MIHTERFVDPKPYSERHRRSRAFDFVHGVPAIPPRFSTPPPLPRRKYTIHSTLHHPGAPISAVPLDTWTPSRPHVRSSANFSNPHCLPREGGTRQKGEDF
ncbi:hypothetical protein NL676_026117 [Syzygium grande]|nr:hypothetical protein NL676_026117 [Syzygium grande]